MLQLQPPAFTATPGVVAGMEDKSPVDFFRLFFSGQVLDLIHRETKRYTEQYLKKEREYLQQHPKGRAHEWRKAPLLLKEIEVLLASNGYMWLSHLEVCDFKTCSDT